MKRGVATIPICAILTGCGDPPPHFEAVVEGSSAFNPDMKFETLTIEVDGAREVRGAGHLWSHEIEARYAGACAASTLVRFSGVNARGSVLFPGDLKSGASVTFPSAPHHDLVPLVIEGWQGIEVAMLSGGTLTYDGSEPDVHVFIVTETALCEANDYDFQAVPAGCVPVERATLTFAGKLGSDRPLLGEPADDPDLGDLCVEAYVRDTSDLD